MLDSETKRRIDTARDVLVGKVPDPKSQVEQITIALIYKFMDDMDKEAVELGGKPSFFTGDYEKYSWSKIFDPKLGGHEMLALYGDALATMNHNPNIPQLFREIFKNAYLPYRDPETLKLFLKTISEFKYDHSERLGDAFEYLLSVLGSQGDAGQFRTPRHIIDFIVAVIQPKKNETILDPACGTAGFLISAFKHIMQENTKKNKGDLLTPDERKKLIQNIVGYDISPDMERLSLVNMYLHGFTSPRIYQYDTLTEQDKWNEYYDVVMANPPFMSPKGGIRPHKRFTVQANRSEVLFLDYIAEHLNPTGRAGIIVPEGIIFQSANAYKEIRKLLVKDYLWAVVSLPAGVFNPYSGVKTSVLFLDKTIAKKSDSILFVKIENDGFDLGAQRREIGGSNLPDAANVISIFEKAIQNGKTGELESAELPLKALVISKELVVKSEDYNLTAYKYKGKDTERKTEFDLLKVEDSFDLVKYTTKVQKSEYQERGRFPIVDQSETFVAGYWDKEEDVFRLTKPVVLFGDHTRVFKFVDFDFVLGADGIKILQPNERFEPKFYYYVLRNLEVRNLGYSRHFKELKDMLIPAPPLTMQQEIVVKIESYQKIIDGAKQVVATYKPQISIESEWKIVDLGKAGIEIIDGDRGSNYPQKEEFSKSGDCLFLNTGNVRSDGFNFEVLEFITREKDQQLRKGKLLRNDLVLTTRGTVGNIALYDSTVPHENIRINSGMVLLRPDLKDFLPEFLFFLFQSDFIQDQFESISSGSAQPQLPIRSLVEIRIPILEIDIQRRIVAQIEEERMLIASNKQLINMFEQKVTDTLSRLWEQ